MLKRRIIPKLLLRRSEGFMELVTTRNFEKRFPVGSPISQAKIYNAQVVDELVFLDIDGKVADDDNAINILKKASQELFLPFSIGGGVRNLGHFKRLMNSGADKVIINTAAFLTPGLIKEAAEIYGSQAVIVNVDYRMEQSKPVVYINKGTEAFEGDLIEWLKKFQEIGAGEIFLNSIDRDGTRAGLDIDTLKRVREAIDLPLIASGGLGKAAHFVEGFKEANVDAISAGTYFCFKDENPMQARSQVKNANIPIRIIT